MATAEAVAWAEAKASRLDALSVVGGAGMGLLVGAGVVGADVVWGGAVELLGLAVVLGTAVVGAAVVFGGAVELLGLSVVLGTAVVGAGVVVGGAVELLGLSVVLGTAVVVGLGAAGTRGRRL